MSISFALIAIVINNLKVIDASALAAILFVEPEADIVEQRLRDTVLIAPTLLDHELTNIAFKKWRKHEMAIEQIRDALGARAFINIKLLQVALGAVFDLAVQTKLSGYDAAYLWLARQHEAELVTLDKKLEAAFLSPIGR